MARSRDRGTVGAVTRNQRKATAVRSERAAAIGEHEQVSTDLDPVNHLDECSGCRDAVEFADTAWCSSPACVTAWCSGCDGEQQRLNAGPLRQNLGAILMPVDCI